MIVRHSLTFGNLLLKLSHITQEKKTLQFDILNITRDVNLGPITVKIYFFETERILIDKRKNTINQRTVWQFILSINIQRQQLQEGAIRFHKDNLTKRYETKIYRFSYSLLCIVCYENSIQTWGKIQFYKVSRISIK